MKSLGEIQTLAEALQRAAQWFARCPPLERRESNDTGMPWNAFMRQELVSYLRLI